MEDNPVLLVSMKVVTADNEELEITGIDEIKVIHSYNYDDQATAYIRVPQQIYITWFSYRDNTFYDGVFTLPKDKIEAIIKDKKELSIEAVLSPEGKLKIVIDNKIDIDTFRVKAIDYIWPWKQDRQTEVAATLANDIIEPVFYKESSSRFTTIEYETYNKTDYFRIDTYGENKKLLQLVNNRVNDTMPVGIPQYINIKTTMDSTDMHQHGFYVRFNIPEITSAYRSLIQSENKFELQMHLSDKDSLKSIILKNNRKEKALKKI